MVEARINDPTAIDRDSIAAILDSGRTPTVQFSRPCYTPALLDQVNQLCIEFGDRLEIRFYGHYANDFSAAALAPLRDVRWLSLFGLTSIADSDCLARLPSLTRFSFGVQEFDDPAFLEKLDLTRITNLTLSANAKRNLDLAALGNAATLENLSLQGHSKNIEAITGLPALHSVSLSGFPNTRDLAFLNRLAPLRCVRVFSAAGHRSASCCILALKRSRFSGSETWKISARSPASRACVSCRSRINYSFDRSTCPGRSSENFSFSTARLSKRSKASRHWASW